MQSVSVLDQPKVGCSGRGAQLEKGVAPGRRESGGLVCEGSAEIAITIAKQRRESSFKLLIPSKQCIGVASSASS